MIKKIKYGKLLAVVFLTCLIWVWADRRLDEDYVVRDKVMISIAKSATPNLWMSFGGESSASIKEVKFRGPVSKVDGVRRELNEGSLVLDDLFLEPEQEEGMTGSGEHKWDVLGTLFVDVCELLKKSLKVECVSEGRIPIEDAICDPATVEMFVPEDKDTAEVLLTRSEIGQAMSAPVTKTPYIKLGEDEIRYAETSVKITVPPQEERLKAHIINNVTPGFTFSANTQGKYQVKVELAELMSPVSILATPAAKQAYENQLYQVILEIDDSDINNKSKDFLRKELVYDFPEPFEGRGHIKLNQPARQVKFELIPMVPARADTKE